MVHRLRKNCFLVILKLGSRFLDFLRIFLKKNLSSVTITIGGDKAPRSPPIGGDAHVLHTTATQSRFLQAARSFHAIIISRERNIYPLVVHVDVPSARDAHILFYKLIRPLNIIAVHQSCASNMLSP